MVSLAGRGSHCAAFDALTLEQLPDGELAELARKLRADALRGDRHARGQAHLCEVELRRRHSHALGAPSVHGTLDLRPLAQRGSQRTWWKFW
ncbi:hypothetical protein [Pseudorhodoferax sp.]|uniref:hypothetical protein n=1 Tax=Pseudorhodoferax sp. TaxID=1993553 RepID=UPI002DD6B670|nr:hypothetical protein [Pseudorhodoferax sp.]